MKIFHISDTHIKLGPRWTECCRVLDYFAERVQQKQPGLVLHSGDVYDGKANGLENKYAERWAQRIADVCPLVFIRGNHDAEFEIEAFSRLDTKFPIHAIESPTILKPVTDGAMAIIGCIPWPTAANVMANSGSLESAKRDADDALRDIITNVGDKMEQLARRWPNRTQKILLMHAMVAKSKTAPGQPLRGCDFEVELEDLQRARADLVCLGHIHNAQGWQLDGVNYRYCGSPFHTDFGDWKDKSFTIYDTDELHSFTIEKLPARQMIEVTGSYNRDLGDFMLGSELVDNSEGVEYKFTYDFVPEHSTAAHARAKAWEREAKMHGADSVMLNPQVTVSTRARAPEVATATSDDDKLKAHWSSKGEAPEDIEHTELLVKLHSIQEQA